MNARVSVAVMAHPRRAAVVPELVSRLGVGDDRVVWDRCNVEWDTGRRSLLAFDADATHHVVVQDDALVCADLVAGLEQALPHTPAESIVSLYVGTRKPVVQTVQQAVNRANTAGAAWIVMDRLLWGVGLVIPTHAMAAMVDWCDQLQFPQYDRRIGEYFAKLLGWPVWHTWPTLVDHRTDTTSLLGHGRGRRSHNFAGEGRSALDVDWAAAVVDIRQPSTPVSAPRVGRSTVEYYRTAPGDGGHVMGLHDPYNQRARVAAYYKRTGQMPADAPAADAATGNGLSDVDSGLVPAAPAPPPAPVPVAVTETPPGPDAAAVNGTAGETPAATDGGTDGGTPVRPRANGSAATWRTYLTGLGYTEEDLAGLSRDELIAFADARTAGAAAPRSPPPARPKNPP